MEYIMKKGTFLFEFDGDISLKTPTILYVPKIQYPSGFDITVSEGDIKKDKEQHVSIIIHKNGLHSVKILRK
jgi:hypothetical protein